MGIMSLGEAVLIMFTQFGKKDSIEQMDVYVATLKNEDRTKVLTRMDKLRKTSRFLPTIAEILEPEPIVTKNSENDFLERFRKQSGYLPEYAVKLDDDVYTVRKSLGHRRVINASLQDWKWIEKEALSEYLRIKKGDLSLLPDPNDIKQLPGGARYISARKGISKIADIVKFSDLKINKKIGVSNAG